jgi:molecular chaperone GrpE
MSRRNPEYVPIEVAEKLVAQRDKLAAEVTELRREKSLVEDALRAAKIDAEQSDTRAAEAEAQARELNDMLSRRTAPDDGVVDQLKARVESLTTDLKRIRDRGDKQLEGARRNERSRLLGGLGSVLDSVERALRTAEEDNPWRAGLESIRSQMHAFLRGEGAELTGEVGQAMDPRLHEAVAMVDADGFRRGDIVSVERHGIVLDDGTVARTAQVTVAG